MCLCFRFLAFLAITLAKVSANVNHVLTVYAQDGGENNRLTNTTIELDLPQGVSSGWCASQQIEHKNVSHTVPHSGKNTPWYCTFYAMINRSSSCITKFKTAEPNSKYIINLNMERDTTFNIESKKSEARINIKSPFIIDLGRCVLKGAMVNIYYADSMITLDRAGKWICRFYIQKRRPVNTIITLRRSDHNRIYEVIDGTGPILITEESQDQDKINALLTMFDIQCANNLPMIRPNMNSTYISLEKSAWSESWECNFHNKTENTFCTFNVPDALELSNYMNSMDAARMSGSSSTTTHVLLCLIGVAALVIICLICGICYYKYKVKKSQETVIPPNVIGRAPFETPPEIVYECVYSHPAGLKRPGIRKGTHTDQTQLIVGKQAD